jgi:hypothetical protein
VLNIMAAVSQWEREAIGERTRDALRHKRGNGECVGNIEFGYRLSSATGGIWNQAPPGRPQWSRFGICVAKASPSAGSRRR